MVLEHLASLIGMSLGNAKLANPTAQQAFFDFIFEVEDFDMAFTLVLQLRNRKMADVDELHAVLINEAFKCPLDSIFGLGAVHNGLETVD